MGDFFNGLLGAAYMPCTAPNAVSQEGIPACKPPTRAASMWRLGPKAKAQLKMKVVKGPDVELKFQVSDVLDAVSGLPAGPGTGSLVLTVRLTIDDPVGGEMTLGDIPVSVALPVSGGKASLKWTYNALPLPDLPGTFHMQTISAGIIAPDGGLFAITNVLGTCPDNCIGD